MSARRPLGIKKEDECLEENEFHNPKKLFFFCLTSFLLAILIARLFLVLQRSGTYVGDSPFIIFGFHLHHWAWSLIALVILMPFAYHYRNDKKIFAIFLVVMSFFIGLFLDGIFYENAIIFWEG